MHAGARTAKWDNYNIVAHSGSHNGLHVRAAAREDNQVWDSPWGAMSKCKDFLTGMPCHFEY